MPCRLPLSFVYRRWLRKCVGSTRISAPYCFYVKWNEPRIHYHPKSQAICTDMNEVWTVSANKSTARNALLAITVKDSCISYSLNCITSIGFVEYSAIVSEKKKLRRYFNVLAPGHLYPQYNKCRPPKACYWVLYAYGFPSQKYHI